MTRFNRRAFTKSIISVVETVNRTRQSIIFVVRLHEYHYMIKMEGVLRYKVSTREGYKGALGITRILVRIAKKVIDSSSFDLLDFHSFYLLFIFISSFIDSYIFYCSVADSLLPRFALRMHILVQYSYGNKLCSENENPDVRKPYQKTLGPANFQKILRNSNIILSVKYYRTSEIPYFWPMQVSRRFGVGSFTVHKEYKIQPYKFSGLRSVPRSHVPPAGIQCIIFFILLFRTMAHIGPVSNYCIHCSDRIFGRITEFKNQNGESLPYFCSEE